MKFFYSNLYDFERKRKANDKVDKADIKDFNREFKKEHSSNAFTRSVKAIFTFPKKVICFLTKGKRCNQVDILPPEKTEALPSSATDTPGLLNRADGKEQAQDVQENHSQQPSTSGEVVIEDAQQKAE